MRSSSFARVVIASLGIAVVITLGCGRSPSEPTPVFAMASISPAEGASMGATVAKIGGIGFQSGVTVTVDGSPVNAEVLNANTISLVMPAHAPGNVDVIVNRPFGQAHAKVQRGYTYVGPPVISELLPNIGSTGGGTPIIIRGTGMWSATVTVGGIVTPVDDSDGDFLYLSTPAHAAGTVEVIVTDRYGQTGSGVFTYASPATFDFNGDWQGWAEDASRGIERLLMLTIRDNIVVSVSCGSSSLTVDPPPVVANGEFSFVGSGGVSISGRILSPNFASGSINTASCVNLRWSAEKK